jgi:DNA-binding response OmpR family regulator
MKKISSILIVDDDPDIGDMLKMMLEFKGYSVELLNRAGETQDMLNSRVFDLVILDMLIAGINGMDVCAGIRQNRNFDQLPILMISALPDAKKGCLDAGASEFISKPFEMRELLAKISQLVHTPA